MDSLSVSLGLQSGEQREQDVSPAMLAPRPQRLRRTTESHGWGTQQMGHLLIPSGLVEMAHATEVQRSHGSVRRFGWRGLLGSRNKNTVQVVNFLSPRSSPPLLSLFLFSPIPSCLLFKQGLTI